MSAEDKIVEFLRNRGEEGALQSEISKVLGLSKSTVSEVIQILEERGEVVRERVAGKSMRVWLSEFAPRPVSGLIRVGVLRASEYPHILLACEELGARVKVFDSAIELTRSLAFGTIDLGVSPFITQVMFALTLRSIKIHCVVAMNGSGVLMKKGLEDCEVFATSELSAMESNLKLFLERSGIDLADVSFRYQPNPESMIKRFESCEFDAVAIWEPYFTMLKEKYEHIEFKEAIGDFPCCSLSSNVQFYKSRRDSLEKFIETLKRFAKGFDEKRASELIAEKMEFDVKLVRKSFESYEFLADLKFEHFEFLENYGLKLTKEAVKSITA